MLKVDYIVPDKSLIQNIENDEEKQKFLHEIITYSISSNTKVIVNGIDSLETLFMVKKLGANYVQGDFLSSPSELISMINSEIENMIATDELDNIL